MTPKRAYEIASQWGSYMTGGDPGAVFYSFPINDGRPQNEDHRKQLIAYANDCLKIATARIENCRKKFNTAAVVRQRAAHTQDAKDLRDLIAFFESWPLTLDAFTEGYLTCALWSSNDNANDSGGAPLDDNYSAVDIAPETMASMIEECQDFQTANAATLESAIACRDDYSEARAGHDFWLTRNGHGAGFWDRGLGEHGKKLTEAAKVYGGCDLYIGDDKKIHA